MIMHIRENYSLSICNLLLCFHKFLCWGGEAESFVESNSLSDINKLIKRESSHADSGSKRRNITR